MTAIRLDYHQSDKLDQIWRLYKRLHPSLRPTREQLLGDALDTFLRGLQQFDRYQQSSWSTEMIMQIGTSPDEEDDEPKEDIPTSFYCHTCQWVFEPKEVQHLDTPTGKVYYCPSCGKPTEPRYVPDDHVPF